MKSRSRTPPSGRKPSSDSGASPARDHYQREKARRAKRVGPEHDLLAEARREYEAMLEADAAKGKGGRPKKVARARKPADADFELEEHDGDADATDEEAGEAESEEEEE